ncbi:hypothetical protein D3C87_1828810 [compost metagenome]
MRQPSRLTAITPSTDDTTRAMPSVRLVSKNAAWSTATASATSGRSFSAGMRRFSIRKRWSPNSTAHTSGARGLVSASRGKGSP